MRNVSLQCLKILHSNLVIFKSNLFNSSSTSSICFTFQSGDIQIASMYNTLNGVPSFTFQSGDIQINSVRHTVLKVVVFTFQSGDIQIDLHKA